MPARRYKNKRSKLFRAFAKKHKAVKKKFVKKHKHAAQWLANKNFLLDDIRGHSARLLTGATLGSAVLLASPAILQLPQSSISRVKPFTWFADFSRFLYRLSQPALFTKKDEDVVYKTIEKFYGVSTSFELDKNRLPHYIGYMGLEQHLYRFSGDSLSQHTAFQQAGIAPNRGAFGYFTEEGKSQDEMEDQERFYIVLQTFMISNWNSDWGSLKNWYKFRKFFVVNPENGKAVVAVLGDSGPATWTGKVFGGSPEVMASLGFYPKKHKGRVVVLFLDDPENKIPLGPVAQKGEVL